MSDGRLEDEMEVVLFVGLYELLIGVVGKVMGYFEGEREGVKGGIVMSLVLGGYEVLGLLLDLESCIWDWFMEGERGWEMGKVVEMLMGIVGVGVYLYGWRICYGDLYVYNVLVSKGDGYGLLGDFGVVSVYGEEEDGVERVEVVVFGRLVGDVFGFVEERGEGEWERVMRRGLEEL